MTQRCPTCGQKVKKPLPIRITRENDRLEWRAWIKHWGDEGKSYFIEYWGKKGYADVPSRFPPGYLPLDTPAATAEQGAGSNG